MQDSILNEEMVYYYGYVMGWGEVSEMWMSCDVPRKEGKWYL